MIQDHLECENCFGELFVEEKVCKIKIEASKSERNPSEPFSNRLLENEHIRYVCAKCGTTLNA